MLQSREKATAAVIVALAFAALAALATQVTTASTTTAPSAQTIMITLYASMGNPSGWGRGPLNITNPGPTLTVNQGDTIMFHLFSADGATHMLVIDLDGSGTRSSGDAVSEPFNASGTTLYYPNTPGQFTYFCGTHELSMQWGTIVVRGTAPVNDNAPWFAAGVLVLFVAVVGFAVYRWRHVPVPRKALPKRRGARNGRNAKGKGAARSRQRSGH